MNSLSSRLSPTKFLVHASFSNNNDSSSSPPPPPPPLDAVNKNTTKLPVPGRTTLPLPRKKQQQKLQRRRQKQPSVIEIERAIGAGRFRDADPSELEEEKDTEFDMSVMNFGNESKVEKQLREMGEWLSDKTETSFRSNGKKILKFTMLWLLPIWTFSLLVAAGTIKLNIPGLDDLIM